MNKMKFNKRVQNFLTLTKIAHQPDKFYLYVKDPQKQNTNSQLTNVKMLA